MVNTFIFYAVGYSSGFYPEYLRIYFFETETLEEITEKNPSEAVSVLHFNIPAQQIENSSKKERDITLPYFEQFILV